MGNKGKAERESEEIESDQALEEQDPFDAALDPAPISPRPYKYTSSGKAYNYYQSLNGKWSMWWDEFATALDERGRLKHKTIWAFIKIKVKDPVKRGILYDMLGPEPDKDKTLKAPWLGDWQQRREQGFWIFNKSKLSALKDAYHQKKEALEAARAIAPITVRDIARFDAISSMIDTAFGGMPIDPNEAPDSPRNIKRLRLYLGMQKKVLDIKSDCFGEYYKAFGLNPTQPEQWLNIRAMDALSLPAGQQSGVIDGQIAGQVDVDGHTMRSVPLPDGVSLDDLLLAKALRDKAKMYKMKLPGDLNQFVEDTTTEDIDRVKKRTQ